MTHVVNILHNVVGELTKLFETELEDFKCNCFVLKRNTRLSYSKCLDQTLHARCCVMFRINIFLSAHIT